MDTARASQKGGGSIERMDSQVNLMGETQLMSAKSKFRVSRITQNSRKALMSNNTETIDVYDQWKRNPNTILESRAGSIGGKRTKQGIQEIKDSVIQKHLKMPKMYPKSNKAP